MGKDLDMKVNVLPVLTYNFLHVNDSTIRVDDPETVGIKGKRPDTLPEGVLLNESISFEKAGEIFRINKDKISGNNSEMAGPNGDNSKRDSDQAVRTGMGCDIDNLMISLNVPTDVYTVKEGVKVKTPIVLKYDLDDGERILSSQVICAEKNSEITVIMTYDSDKSSHGFCGISTRLFAMEGARINLIKVQTLGDRFVHFDDIGGLGLVNSSIDLVTLELGGCRVYSSAYIYLSGKETTLSSNMGYLVRGDHFLDINYVADQRGRKTNAAMNFKGVLMDKAEKTFRGTLDFKAGSSGSVGDEQEDALLLGEDVVNRTMPVILCQEEDVEGRHGATIGQLSDELLFYMQTRGFDEQEAKRIMIKARLESVARMIPDPAVMQKTQYYIQNII
ncbi:MAG: SufD family Fe-S cluster assembly protein [Butyrivibrio sp.]|nr:SufD family Fe-S cluster assembly protein [Butyrivibrio sp.]